MDDRHATHLAFGVFADLLEYPSHDPVELLAHCRSLAAPISPEADALLARFGDFARSATLGRLQEEYTRAFDMDESHSLYVGYHLLGESYKRSAFLLELMERYRAHGMEVAGELADHLPVVLRFLTVCDDEELADEVVGDAVWPFLEMMFREDDEAEEPPDDGRPVAVTPPYHELVEALLWLVRASPMGSTQPLLVTSAVGWPTT